MTSPVLRDRVLERHQFIERLVRTAHERTKAVGDEVFLIYLAEALLRYLATKKKGFQDPRSIGRNFYPPLAQFFEEALSSVADFARTTAESDELVARFLEEITKEVVSGFRVGPFTQEAARE